MWQIIHRWAEVWIIRVRGEIGLKREHIQDEYLPEQSEILRSLWLRVSSNVESEKSMG